MNKLKLHTRQIGDKTFDVYWWTGTYTIGRVRVTVQAPLAEAPSEEQRKRDRAIAAELSACRYLLEDCNVCGHNKTGTGLQIHFTFGAISRLTRAVSAKDYLAPYALFLRTRFVGCEIEIDKASDWVPEEVSRHAELEVKGPILCHIEVAGIGPVDVTAHAVEQYCERFNRPPLKAWIDLIKISRKVEPEVAVGRSAFADTKHRRQGRFFINRDRRLRLVITPADRLGGHPKLVTVIAPENTTA